MSYQECCTNDIDASVVEFKFIGKAIGPCNTVSGIAEALAITGLNVCIMCDGTSHQ